MSIMLSKTIMIDSERIRFNRIGLSPTLQILQMMERVVPLMEHPGDEFLQQTDRRLDFLLQNLSIPSVLSATISCAGALYRNFPRFEPRLCKQFPRYLQYLDMNSVALKAQEGPIRKETINLLRK